MTISEEKKLFILSLYAAAFITFFSNILLENKYYLFLAIITIPLIIFIFYEKLTVDPFFPLWKLEYEFEYIAYEHISRIYDSLKRDFDFLEMIPPGEFIHLYQNYFNTKKLTINCRKKESPAYIINDFEFVGLKLENSSEKKESLLLKKFIPKRYAFVNFWNKNLKYACNLRRKAIMKMKRELFISFSEWLREYSDWKIRVQDNIITITPEIEEKTQSILIKFLKFIDIGYTIYDTDSEIRINADSGEILFYTNSNYRKIPSSPTANTYIQQKEIIEIFEDYLKDFLDEKNQINIMKHKYEREDEIKVVWMKEGSERLYETMKIKSKILNTRSKIDQLRYFI